jgi:hypothetical protein
MPRLAGVVGYTFGFGLNALYHMLPAPIASLMFWLLAGSLKYAFDGFPIPRLFGRDHQGEDAGYVGPLRVRQICWEELH